MCDSTHSRHTMCHRPIIRTTRTFTGNSLTCDEQVEQVSDLFWLIMLQRRSPPPLKREAHHTCKSVEFHTNCSDRFEVRYSLDSPESRNALHTENEYEQ